MSLQLPSWVQELFETDEDVLFFLDRDLRIADCNVGWDKFAIANGGVGISREEIRGRNIYELIPEVLVQFYRDKYSEALRTRLWIGFDSNVPLRRFRGSTTWRCAPSSLRACWW